MRLPNDTPIPLAVGLVMILVLVIQMVVGSGGLSLALLFSPSLFVLYRVYTRDNLARWVTTGLVCGLVLVAALQLASYRNRTMDSATLAAVPSESRDTYVNAIEGGIYSMIGGLTWLSVAVILLHLPSCNEWFRQSRE